MLWLHNFIAVVIGGSWILGTASAFAYGVQGLWRPENKYWQIILPLSLLSTAAMFTTLITDLHR